MYSFNFFPSLFVPITVKIQERQPYLIQLHAG